MFAVCFTRTTSLTAVLRPRTITQVCFISSSFSGCFAGVTCKNRKIQRRDDVCYCFTVIYNQTCLSSLCCMQVNEGISPRCELETVWWTLVCPSFRVISHAEVTARCAVGNRISVWCDTSFNDWWPSVTPAHPEHLKEVHRVSETTVLKFKFFTALK